MGFKRWLHIKNPELEVMFLLAQSHSFSLLYLSSLPCFLFLSLQLRKYINAPFKNMEQAFSFLPYPYVGEEQIKVSGVCFINPF